MKLEKVLVEFKETKSLVGVKSVGLVLDSKRKPVKLSPLEPVPHILEENGGMVVEIPGLMRV